MLRLSSRIAEVLRSHIVAGPGALGQLGRFIHELRPQPGKIFILTDANTHEKCLPVLLQSCQDLQPDAIWKVAAGEASKSIDTVNTLYYQLLQARAGRNDLLLNLGGGVVSDLGGFIAASYLRGIRYINIPTSLIGQADAAIGGKAAIDIGPLKNQAGFFHPPVAVLIDPIFLETLPSDHRRSGMAEIVKMILISGGALWNRIQKAGATKCCTLKPDDPFLHKLLLHAVKEKNALITRDYRERNVRKRLNFGHTVGHALESWSLKSGAPMHHGDAVAAGMACAVSLSAMKTGLPPATRDALIRFMLEGFIIPSIQPRDYDELLGIMEHDKKTVNGRYRFTLLKEIGKPVLNAECSREEVVNALNTCFL
jgi:3-dehydroquinate synthase